MKRLVAVEFQDFNAFKFFAGQHHQGEETFGIRTSVKRSHVFVPLAQINSFFLHDQVLKALLADYWRQKSPLIRSDISRGTAGVLKSVGRGFSPDT